METIDMKKFIFINNDNENIAQNELKHVEFALKDICNVKQPDISIVADFYNLSKEEQYKILFEQEGIICTYSSYCAGDVVNSGVQFMKLLAAAGRNRIQDRIYLDTLGLLFDTLNRLLTDTQSPLDVLIGIAQNEILTCYKGKLFRIVVDPNMTFQGYVKLQSVVF